MSDTGATIYLLFTLALAVFFRMHSLETRIDSEGIHYRYRPYFKWRSIKWKEIRQSEVIRYPFVGYGIRWGIDHNWVYNVKGQNGISIKTDHSSLLIGTQKKQEAQSIITYNCKL